jgi:hypothetical protein
MSEEQMLSGNQGHFSHLRLLMIDVDDLQEMLNP